MGVYAAPRQGEEFPRAEAWVGRRFGSGAPGHISRVTPPHICSFHSIWYHTRSTYITLISISYQGIIVCTWYTRQYNYTVLYIHCRLGSNIYST